MQRRRPQSAYLKKLMTVCTLLGTIPLLIVGIFSCVESTKIVLAQAEDLNSYSLSQTQIAVEQTLKSMERLTSAIANSETILAAVQTPYEKLNYQLVSEVMAEKFAGENVDLSFEDIYFISVRNGWILSNRGIQAADEVIPKQYSYLYEGKLPFETLWIYSPTNDIYPSELSYQNYDSVNIIMRIPRFTSVPDGVAVANIHISQLEQLVAQKSRLSGIAVLDGEGRPILGGEVLDRTLWTELSEKLIHQSEPQGSFSFHQNNYHINFVRSDFNGWYYLNVLDIPTYTKDTWSIAWTTIAVVLITGVLMICLSGIVSRKMYLPIFQLKNFVSQNFMEKKDEPSHEEKDDFFQISSHLEKHLDLTRVKEQLFKEQSAALRDLYFQKLLEGHWSKEQSSKYLKAVGCVETWKWMCVCAVRIDSLESSAFQGEDTDLAVFAVSNIIGELTSPESLIGPLYKEGYLVMILGSSMSLGQSAKDAFLGISENLSDTISRVLKIRMTIGLSRPIQEADAISRAWQEAQDALNYSMLTDTASIIDIDEIQNRSFRIVFPQHISDDFFNALRSNDREGARWQLDLFIQQISSESVSLQSCRITILRFVIAVQEYMQKMGGSIRLLDASQIYSRLFAASSYEEIRQLLNDMLLPPLFELIEKQLENQERRISERIFEFLSQDESCSLSLEECASRLHYSPSYISRVFKKETGQSYKEYQMLYRFERAKLLLSTTDMRVSEIARSLNYNNTQNFIRYFKNIEGITPNQYRAQQQGVDRGQE